MALRRVVHAQFVADRGADHHLAGVEPHAHGKAEGRAAADLFAEGAQLVAQVQRGVAGALRRGPRARSARANRAMMPSPVYWFTVPLVSDARRR